MERWQFIGWGIAASVLAHFLLAGAIFLSTDVHTYDQAAPDPIAVDVVSEQPEKAPEPTPTPSPDLVLPKPAASSSPQPAAAQQQAAAPAQPSPQPTPQPTPRETAKPQAEPAPQPRPQQQPPPQQQAQPQPEPPPPQSGQGYIPAQPDLTVRYGVMLGLPDALPPLAVTTDKRDDDKEAGATATKNLSTDLVTTFRQHLRSCSRLPASISPGDNVRVKLRVLMTPDGRIAGEPVLIEGTASLKGVDLKQGAVSALTACQPYAMLPADRYREWRVLELSFTPQDFAS